MFKMNLMITPDFFLHLIYRLIFNMSNFIDLGFEEDSMFVVVLFWGRWQFLNLINLTRINLVFKFNLLFIILLAFFVVVVTYNASF